MIADGNLGIWAALSDTLLKCTPFLMFDGNCAEAMTFYHECLGGELTLTKLGDSSMKDQLAPEKHDRIINAHLKRGDFEISATDWMASPAFDPVQGNTSAIFVVGDNYDELKAVFDKLVSLATRSKNDFKSCTRCPLEPTGSFMTNMAFSGSS